METIIFLFALAGFGVFVWRRLPRYLHILQQDDYDNRRFLNWLVVTRTFDKRVSAVLLVTAILGWAFSFYTDNLLFAIVFAVSAFFESNPRKEAKKKLVMTRRAKRIFYTALALNLIFAGILFALNFAFLSIIAVQAIPLLLISANKLLEPMEARIQAKFLREASERLAKINPHVIGVTGSFGKTSVKHILGHILELNAPTFYTPGSVNTLMGISRMIRENLQADCKYFLVEMGAYGEGSIKKLCDLTPPSSGIITALGEAHVERFKTLDTVARAKFELAEAVLLRSGKIVIHENVLAQEYAAQFVKDNRVRFMICGRQPNVDVRIERVEQTVTGLTVHVNWRGQTDVLTAPLFGKHHAENMALAYAMAVTLGLTPDRIIAALRSVPQIKHRLEVKPQSNGIIYIDDAFNSNPAGFQGALEVMTLLASEKPRRRIIVTPGLVELGEKHDEIHRMLGEASAKQVDVAIAVRPERIPTFIEGFRSANGQGVLHTAANLAEALKWLAAHGRPDDIVLLENDLPDVYERRLAI